MTTEICVEQIGRFEILDKIGQGAMGMVYKVRDPTMDRVSAMKVVHEALADAKIKERFRIEAQAAGMLNHPNIVTIYDFGEADGLPYIMMEFLDGQDLENLLRLGVSLPMERRVAIMAQAADALHFAHQKGVVHRDVKPGNIFLLRNGTAKIMDFGIAKVADTKLTRTGSVLGTVHYMSPEQLRGHELDGRSDLFSLGVTSYQLLTRRNPFAAKDLSSMMYSIINETAAPMHELEGTPWEWLEPVVLRCLAKKRDRRWPDCAQFADALHMGLAGSPPAVVLACETGATRALQGASEEEEEEGRNRETKPGRGARRRRSRLLWLVPALGLALIVAIVGFRMSQGETPDQLISELQQLPTWYAQEIERLRGGEAGSSSVRPVSLPAVTPPGGPATVSTPAGGQTGPTPAAQATRTPPTPTPRPRSTATPAPTPTPRRERAGLLVAQADKLRRSDQLAEPGGSAALELYQEALRLDPGNGQARAGVTAIRDHFLVLGDQALEARDFAAASTAFAQARIASDDSVVAGRLRSLEQAEAQADRQSESAQAWQAARGERSVQAIEAFLRRHPNAPGSIQEEARGLMATLRDDEAFERAAGAGDWSSLDAYLADFPQGRHREAAEKRRKGMLGQVYAALEEAEKKRSPDDLTRFIARFPQAPADLKERARQGVKRLEREDDDAYAKAMAGTRRDVIDYIKTWPRGRHVEEALEWVQAPEQGKMALWLVTAVADRVKGVKKPKSDVQAIDFLSSLGIAPCDGVWVKDARVTPDSFRCIAGQDPTSSEKAYVMDNRRFIQIVEQKLKERGR